MTYERWYQRIQKKLMNFQIQRYDKLLLHIGNIYVVVG